MHNEPFRPSSLAGPLLMLAGLAALIAAGATLAEKEAAEEPRVSGLSSLVRGG